MFPIIHSLLGGGVGVSYSDYAFLANTISFYEMENLVDSHGIYDLTNNNGVTFTAGLVNNAATFVQASSQYLSNSSVSLAGNVLTVSV